MLVCGNDARSILETFSYAVLLFWHIVPLKQLLIWTIRTFYQRINKAAGVLLLIKLL